jgi:thiamine-phosphate pyrophosphorylase
LSVAAPAVFELYLITPERTPAEILATTELLLAEAPPGRLAVQLRAKHLTEPARRGLAHALRASTRERSAPLLINADLALAREVGADGVQLPEHGPGVREARAALGFATLIGASRHDLAGVEAATLDGASFVTLSPVFAVPEKGVPLGVGQFSAIANGSRLPVFALGGITADRTLRVVQAGAHGVAVIRQLFDSEQPTRALRALLAAIDAGKLSRAGSALSGRS